MHHALGHALPIEMGHLSKSRKSSNTTGPRGPTVSEFWLSPTGRPAAVVSFFFAMIFSSMCFGSFLIWLRQTARQVLKPEA